MSRALPIDTERGDLLMRALEDHAARRFGALEEDPTDFALVDLDTVEALAELAGEILEACSDATPNYLAPPPLTRWPALLRLQRLAALARRERSRGVDEHDAWDALACLAAAARDGRTVAAWVGPDADPPTGPPSVTGRPAILLAPRIGSPRAWLWHDADGWQDLDLPALRHLDDDYRPAGAA